MKTIVLIPARYGSTRFPGKPLALIQGLPMIQHVYQRALACGEVNEISIATDDERIIRCVQGFGGRAILTGKDHPSGTDRIAEAAEILGTAGDDIIVNIQGDQPLFHPSLIPALVEPLRRDRDLPMSTFKCRIEDPEELSNPNHVKVVTDSKGHALYFSRSPIPFFRDDTSHWEHYKHIGIYAYRMSFLRTFTRLPVGRLESAEKLEQLRALEYGYRIKVVETAHDSIEVDTPADIGKVEKLMSHSDS